MEIEVKPITPEEVESAKISAIPPEVIEVFNALIVERWEGSSATVFQKDAVERIASKLNLTTGQVYEKSLLEIENVYCAAGWRVYYDKPAFNEDYDPYDPYFVFSKN
jgi:hypothetical protein